MADGANGAGFGGNIGGSGGVNGITPQSGTSPSKVNENGINQEIFAVNIPTEQDIDLTGTQNIPGDISGREENNSLGKKEMELRDNAISMCSEFYELDPGDRFDVLVEAAGLNKDELTNVAMNAVNTGYKCCVALQNIAGNPEAMKIVGKMDLDTLVKTLENNVKNMA